MKFLLWYQDHVTVTLYDITVQFWANKRLSMVKSIRSGIRITELTVKPDVEALPLKAILKKTANEFLTGNGLTLLTGLLYHVDRTICNHLSW